jgi:hypothetical protein
MKSHVEKWIVGAALAVALPALIPVIRETAGPLMARGNRLARRTARQAATLAVKVRHELEDIWYEAEAERMEKRWKQKQWGMQVD